MSPLCFPIFFCKDEPEKSCKNLIKYCVICSRYLASGCSFRELSHSFRIGHTTVRDIVYDVYVAIWQNVKDMAFPKIFKQYTVS